MANKKKLDPFAVHELLDRTFMMETIINEWLIKNKVTAKNPKIKKALLKACDGLADAYRLIGDLKDYE